MNPAPDLVSVLSEARDLGFLGPGPVTAHVDHAMRAGAALAGAVVVVDLGSGGGVPALPLALALPGTSWTLVEAQTRRADWLQSAIDRLGLGLRMRVRTERAEVTGRGDLRGRADAVIARSFGAPAVTAECGAPLLRLGGVLVVAEPPDAPVVTAPTSRWAASDLALLGLAPKASELASWALLEQVGICPDRYPRRVGIPAKRPLFGST